MKYKAAQIIPYFGKWPEWIGFFRNNDYYRNLCFKIKDWREKITSDTPMSLDELEFTYIVCPLFQTIGRIHKYLCRPLGIHYFKVLDTLNPLFHKKVLLHEYGTSPEPQNGGGHMAVRQEQGLGRQGQRVALPPLPLLQEDAVAQDGPVLA